MEEKVSVVEVKNLLEAEMVDIFIGKVRVCGFIAVSYLSWVWFHCGFISVLGAVSLRFHIYQARFLWDFITLLDAVSLRFLSFSGYGFIAISLRFLFFSCGYHRTSST